MAQRSRLSHERAARRWPRSGRSGSDAASASNGVAVDAPEAAADGVVAKPAGSAEPRPRGRPNRAESRPVDVLLAGKLEAMLREAGDGMSASAIARRCERRLRSGRRAPQCAGAVRPRATDRAGRTSVGRLVTDEEWIAAQLLSSSGRARLPRVRGGLGGSVDEVGGCRSRSAPVG
jgi:hypothetical protein